MMNIYLTHRVQPAESITVTNSYPLEATGASLSQELTDFPDIGNLAMDIKLYFSIPNNHNASFSLFNTRTPVGDQSIWAGDIVVTVASTTMYVAVYNENSTFR